MIALSIRQPWAWAILYGGKRIENRSWRCDYRGPILIHASKLPVPKRALPGWFVQDWESVRAAMHASNVDIFKCPPVTFKSLVLQSGAIVGKARIVDCVSHHPSAWFAGPWGLILEDVEPTPVVPCKGRLGLWQVPANVLPFLTGELP